MYRNPGLVMNIWVGNARPTSLHAGEWGVGCLHNRTYGVKTRGMRVGEGKMEGDERGEQKKNENKKR